MAKVIGRCAALALATIVLLTAAALGYRALRQHDNAEALAIHTPNGIQEAMFVPIGGIDQWIEIGGEDRRNPAILFQHGGPGNSETALFSLFRPWEKYFTVVMWDQRCAGKTFVRNGPKSCEGMNVESVAHEGIALTEYLKRHLHKSKIIALGHSWGTMIGVRMVKERPDLYAAYVGTGQVVSIPEKEAVIFDATMAKLRAMHDEEGIRALEKIGPPPYKSYRDLGVERAWSGRTDISPERDLRSNMTTVVLFAPGWSLWDTYQTFERAPDYAERATFAADADYDARKLGTKFDVPFFVFNGEFDSITPTPLAKRYFDSISAPTKAFVVLKGGGHSAVLTMPDVFLRELIAHLRPGKK